MQVQTPPIILGVWAVHPRNLDTVAGSTGDGGGGVDWKRCGIRSADRGFGGFGMYGERKPGGVEIVVREICAAPAPVMKRSSILDATILGLKYVERGCSFRAVSDRAAAAHR